MIEYPRQIILQIIGSLMKKPSLLDDSEKYNIDPTEFSQSLDKYIYSALYNLYINGAEKITIPDIDAYL